MDILNNYDTAQNDVSAWEHVKKARAATRPSSMDYVNKIFTEFFELHGDRYFSDDPAIVSGIGLPKWIMQYGITMTKMA